MGPDECDCLTTGELVEKFCHAWGDAGWICQSDNGPHEANFLKLDCSKIKKVFGWQPRWHIDEAISRIVEWNKVYLDGGNIPAEMDREIALFGEK